MTRAIPFLAAFVSSIASAACSSSPSTKTTVTPPANVSFANDVIPVFQANCTMSQVLCHGSTTDPTMSMQPRPFLGAPFGTPDMPTLQAIHDGIVNTKSAEDPTMNYVTPSDTSNSYLFYKISATQGSLMALCSTVTDPPCGLSMPYTGGSISSQDLATIQGWIEQGALLN